MIARSVGIYHRPPNGNVDTAELCNLSVCNARGRAAEGEPRATVLLGSAHGAS